MSSMNLRRGRQADSFIHLPCFKQATNATVGTKMNSNTIPNKKKFRSAFYPHSTVFSKVTSPWSLKIGLVFYMI